MNRVHLHINDQAVQASAHDTVLAALINAGLRWTRRDTEGAPRFALCGMGVCQECAVCIDGQPGQLACLRRCRDGMQVHTDV